MKLLINTSNLYVGGGVQVALSFVHELKQIMRNHEYHIVLSPVTKKHIEIESFPNNFYFYQIEKSPASLKSRHGIVEKLNELENKIKADIVFTIFGPSYWQPKAPHLLGIADGWVYNPDSIAYDRLSFFKRLKMRLHGKYKIHYFRRDADFYVIETDDAKIKFSKIARINKNHVTVVGNTYSSIFDDEGYTKESNEFYIKLPKKHSGEFRLMYIAHNHANKNLKIINNLLPLLKKQNIRFVLTLDEDSFQNLFPIESRNILNIGPISQKSCPSIYDQCDALFAPTLLETFSASYPEAMKMEKPIMTSNYSFAKDTCQDAALYFDPLNAKDIADKINSLVGNPSLQNSLIKKGKRRLLEFETASSRAKKYLSLCENIVNHNQKNQSHQ